MKPNSIAILTPDVSVAGAALANYTAALMQGLHQLDVPTLYVVYFCSRPGPQVTFPANVKLVALNVKRSRSLLLPLAKFLRQYQPDVLITLAAFVNFPATIGWLLAGKGKTRLIVSQHSTMSYKAYVECKNNVLERANPLMARLLYPLATAVHANSQEVLHDLIEEIRIPLPEARAFFTPNPINSALVRDCSQAASDHPWLQHKDKPVIISAGRLAKQKNFPLLLHAFAAVRQRLDVRLIILGEDGPERQHLQQLIQTLGISASVSLPGFSPNPWSSMAKADVFVLPSQEEPFGLVLVEAMACGVPVIATDAIGGGPRMILEEGKNGILLPQNDVEALTDAIVKVLTFPEVHYQLVNAGHQRCTAFSPKAIAQQWLDHLQKLS